MDEKIEVGYRNIGSVAGKDYHHKFLLYTDKNGEQHTISGWTGEEKPGLPYGRMHVESNLPYDRTNPDHPDNLNAKGQKQYREEIVTGPDLSKTWDKMVADAQSKSDKYPYDPQVQNSNTLADSVLRDAKLKEPTQDGFFGHWAPASGRALDESIKPSEPGLGNSGRTISTSDAKPDPQREGQLRADPMFQQALTGLDKIGPNAGVYDNQQDKERVAGALALQARKAGLPEIQEVVPSQTNGNVFAMWKNPGNEADLLRAHVDRGEAAQQPLQANLEKLETATRQQKEQQARAPEPVQQQAQGEQEAPSRGSLSR